MGAQVDDALHMVLSPEGTRALYPHVDDATDGGLYCAAPQWKATLSKVHVGQSLAIARPVPHSRPLLPLLLRQKLLDGSDHTTHSRGFRSGQPASFSRRTETAEYWRADLHRWDSEGTKGCVRPAPISAVAAGVTGAAGLRSPAREPGLTGLHGVVRSWRARPCEPVASGADHDRCSATSRQRPIVRSTQCPATRSRLPQTPTAETIPVPLVPQVCGGTQRGSPFFGTTPFGRGAAPFATVQMT